MASRLAIVLGISLLLAGGYAVRSLVRQPAQAAAATERGPLLGSSITSKADLVRDNREFGRMGIVRTYYPGLPAASAWTTGLPAANHSAVIVSFKALPSAILSGSDNAVLSHFFDSAPAGHPIYYSYYHEPEDNISAGEFTAAAYRHAWAHIVALARAASNPALHATLILKARDLLPGSRWNWKDYLPGGGIISTLGWDAYPVGSADNVNPQPTPPALFMGRAIAASKKAGLPFGIAEFGLSTPVGRAAWMKRVGSYLVRSGAVFATLYDGSSRIPALRMNDRASIAVWRSFVSHQRAPAPAQRPERSPSKRIAHAPAGPRIASLTVTPAARATHSVRITFELSQRADVTVCVLRTDGTVARQLARPRRGAGLVTIRYRGHRPAGRRLPAGDYRILVVASNARGSGNVEGALTISAAP
ncbi:MAG TPA: hypothetical protein VGI64_09740 [Streptosporangiaceae bacterium]|jgi:hypothetical protein